MILLYLLLFMLLKLALLLLLMKRTFHYSQYNVCIPYLAFLDLWTESEEMKRATGSEKTFIEVIKGKTTDS